MSSPLTPKSFNSLDDLLNITYKEILQNGETLNGKRGVIKEIMNYSAVLNDSRSRTSASLDRRLVRSKFAEFAWYLSKDSNKDYISPYISAYNNEEVENKKILGAYGPKLFDSSKNSISQFDRICDQILERKSTKQAYIAISNQNDYKVRTGKHSSPPCTIGLHFLVRNDKLNLTAYMRSNDAYFGLPHDLFCFTMIQEMVAKKVGIELGIYTHISSSMHIYNIHINRVKSYLAEGYFETVSMPEMDQYDDSTLQQIINSYDDILPISKPAHLSPYWNDFSLFSNRNFENPNFSEKNWLNLFKTKELRQIANLSINK